MNIRKGKVADVLAIAALGCFAVAYLASTQVESTGARELIEIMVIFGAGFLVGFAFVMYDIVKGQDNAPYDAKTSKLAL